MGTYQIIEKSQEGIISVVETGLSRSDARTNRKGSQMIVKKQSFKQHNKLIETGIKVRESKLKKKRKRIMAKANLWDFNKLPENKYNYAIGLYEDRNVSKLIQLHDLYKLSITNYCCGSDLDKKIMGWYKHAIDEKLIYKV